MRTQPVYEFRRPGRSSPLVADLDRHLDPFAADALLLAAGRGDPAALGTLFDRTAAVVYGCMRRVVKDSADAATATANVYVQLWRTATRFRPGPWSAHDTLVQLIRYELIQQHHSADRTGASSPHLPGSVS